MKLNNDVKLLSGLTPDCHLHIFTTTADMDESEPKKKRKIGESKWCPWSSIPTTSDHVTRIKDNIVFARDLFSKAASGSFTNIDKYTATSIINLIIRNIWLVRPWEAETLRWKEISIETLDRFSHLLLQQRPKDRVEIVPWEWVYSFVVNETLDIIFTEGVSVSLSSSKSSCSLMNMSHSCLCAAWCVSQCIHSRH